MLATRRYVNLCRQNCFGFEGQRRRCSLVPEVFGEEVRVRDVRWAECTWQWSVVSLTQLTQPRRRGLQQYQYSDLLGVLEKHPIVITATRTNDFLQRIFRAACGVERSRAR